MRNVAKIGAIKNIDTLLKLIDEATATGYPAAIPKAAEAKARSLTQSAFGRRRIPIVTIPNPIAAVQFKRCNPLKTACKEAVSWA